MNNYESTPVKTHITPWQLFAGLLSGGFILLAFGSLFFRYPFAIGFPGLVLIYSFSLLILSTSLNTARHPLRGDIIIAVIIIIGIIGNIWGIFWYYYGSAALSDMSDLDWFLLVARPGFVFLFFGFFIYLLIKSFKSDLAPKEFIIRIIFLLLIVIAFLVRPYLYESGQILFLKGLSKAIKNNITVSAIQDWLSQQDIPAKEPDPQYRTPYYLKGVGRILYEPDAQPECVKKFSRGRPIFVLYDWHSKDFYILQAGDSPWTWGFNLGIFQWRVVIGLSTMALPPLKYQSETILQFSPGVYGWCDYQNLLFRSDNQKK